MKKIVLTGGTGFIGGNLINTFSTSDEVYNIGRSIDLNSNSLEWDFKSDINEIKLPRSIDTVIHCASIVNSSDYDNKEYIDINVLATLQLLEYCSKNDVKHFIFVSTGGVYGYGDEAFKEDDYCNPKGIYSITKYFAEKLCMEYSDKIDITILRVFFPYGKGQRGRLISNLVEKIKSGDEIIINKDGKPYINPIHIYDLCLIVKEIVEKRTVGTFNICGNEIVSIEQLCYIIANNNMISKLNLNFTNNYSSSLIGNNNKITNHLKYKYKISLSEGILLDQ